MARFAPQPGARRAERIERAEQMLSRALNLRTLVAVVGNGCSRPLGYPSWTGFARQALEHSIAALEERRDEPEAAAALADVLGLREALGEAEIVPANDLTFYLGSCKRLLDRLEWPEHPYAEYVRRRFGPEGEGEHPPLDAQPHHALAELPIQRFVTTNYDRELELVLAEHGRVAYEDFGIGEAEPEPERSRSFTQEERDCDFLARFCVARPRARPLVFHCHGRYDRPKSIIATEEDYQRWYLSGGEGMGSHFRQLIDLLFGSSSLLFVGYGMGDEDLLKPLRALGATEPGRKHYRPIFALVPEEEPGADWRRHEVLFERYGLHVIPYASRRAGTPEERGRDLATALREVGLGHARWLDGWLEKPVIRKVVVRARPPRPYRHYNIDLRGHEALGEEKVTETLNHFVAATREAARSGRGQVLCLVGPGGGGKSWHAVQLMERVEREVPELDGFFFWSSYYADDYLTGLDRALAYLDPTGETAGARHDRFGQCLERGRWFVVFDGFERLLREAPDPEEGVPFGKGAERLLEALLDKGGRSTVVITTRLRPRGLREGEGVLVRRIGRLRAEDLRSSALFAPFAEHAAALCSLLDGHSYGLLLAGEYLQRKASEARAGEAARTLRRELAASAPDRRLGRMIGLVERDLNRRHRGLVREVLERVAVFMSPLTERTLELCFEEARKSQPGGPPEPGPDVERVIRDLLASRLVFQVVTSEDEADLPAFTVHPTVRSYLFHRVHRTTPDMLPNFTLPGFTSGTAMASPTSAESAWTAKGLFDRLVAEAESARRAGRAGEARELCRSAFSVMRSRLEAITAPRWTKHGDYLLVGLTLANLAKDVAPEVWDYREAHLLSEVEHADGPLFADEIAWLYNDIGLTLCAEGDMHDTYGVWEQGYEINRLIEGGEPPGQYVVQSQLHLAHTFIEMGLLQSGEQYLQETEHSNRSLGDSDYQGRIVGYRGLIAHLRGDWGRADELYELTQKLVAEAGGNPRAESIFLRFWADLRIARRDLPGAAELIQAARVKAEAGHHPDLVAYAIESLGHWHRAREEFRPARLAFDDALERSRRLGIRRLEASVLSQMARLGLDLGDTEMARLRALASMAIANELGLGLRQTHGLVLLGLAALQGGQRDLGVAYLRHGWSRARRQQYWSRGREAEQRLQAEGETVGFEW